MKIKLQKIGEGGGSKKWKGNGHKIIKLIRGRKFIKLLINTNLVHLSSEHSEHLFLSLMK